MRCRDAIPAGLRVASRPTRTEAGVVSDLFMIGALTCQAWTASGDCLMNAIGGER